MKNKIIFIYSIILLVLFVNLVNAGNAPLTVKMDKNVYYIGDRLVIYSEVHNFKDNDVTVILNNIIKDDRGNYPFAVVPNFFVLKKNETRTIIIKNITIDEKFPAGKYTMNVSLLFDKMLIDKETLQFEVISSVRNIPLILKLCRDENCSEETNVFLKNEPVYLTYSSDIENLTIDSNIIYPDGHKEKISLPGSIIPEQNGTYGLEITTSKSGYKNVYKNEQFAVIDKNANIPFLPVDSKTQNNQTNQTKTSNNTNNYILTFMIVAVIFIMVLISLLLIRNKMSKNNNPNGR